ncbi:MAG: adenylyl-sulfate kinase [Pseudohongiella sp.]|uniref:adenylyl-sulfate kinase n=1 Tax=Pseudohongiella sp. TaxID=1979412 RepID=UPI0034A08E8B
MNNEQKGGGRPPVIWFTGLSGAGKTTLAQEVERLLVSQACPVVRLDGDILRKGLCTDLGFSLADRTENMRRAAEVARLFVDAGHVVLAAFISPMAEERARVRALIEADGGRFIEVYVQVPLAIAEQRDVKGLYQKARRGELSNFTGIDSPYEAPVSPELIVSTEHDTPQQSAAKVLACL